MADTKAEHATGHDHPAHLAHHFETPRQQFEAGKLGMWLFLSTEILLFSGLFCAYAVYRANHPEIFQYAHQYLDKTLGGVNTVILICSSLTMAWAVRCAQCNRKTGLVVNLVLTLLFACGFLSVKYVEYRHKWKEGLLWGQRFDPTHPPGVDPHSGSGHDAHSESHGDEHAGLDEHAEHDLANGPSQTVILPPAPPGARGEPGFAWMPWTAGQKAHAEIKERPANVHIFFGVYFAMTGLHGLHVIAGMAVIFWLLVRAIRGHFSTDYFTPVDLGGLYWHLVDLIWIYLFPLLYLIH